MAATERVSMINSNSRPLHEDADHFVQGLRIAARTTTASLSDYPEWTMDELTSHRRDFIVTDGACS